MNTCPHCGATLAPALVAAIKDPERPESCPRAPKADTKAAANLAGIRKALRGFALLAALARLAS